MNTGSDSEGSIDSQLSTSHDGILYSITPPEGAHVRSMTLPEIEEVYMDKLQHAILAAEAEISSKNGRSVKWYESYFSALFLEDIIITEVHHNTGAPGFASAFRSFKFCIRDPENENSSFVSKVREYAEHVRRIMNTSPSQIDEEKIVFRGLAGTIELIVTNNVLKVCSATGLKFSQNGEVYDETAREKFKADCELLISSEHTEFIEIISHFPERAELFLKTQKHAQNITGEKRIHYTITHSEDGSGVTGDQVYSAGNTEGLHIHGETGRDIIEAINSIRTVTKRNSQQDYPIPSTKSVLRIADVLTGNKLDSLSLRIIATMNLSDAEKKTIIDYAEKEKKRQDIIEKIQAIQSEVANLQEQLETLKTETASLEKE